MADEDHLKILKQGVAAWNALRDNCPTLLPDLTEADLIEVSLYGANLHKANLSKANLSRMTLSKANLVDADLREAALFRASLFDANLGHANLFQAQLGEANLRGANLSGADLSRANLSKADLSRANLGSANLTQARLTWTNLTKANLSEANLRGVMLYDTVLSAVDFSTTKHLDSCKHIGPSIIDHRTLQQSGTLPPQFLRGCGLPEEFIEYIPSLFTGTAIQFYSCFISYSHADKPFARRLHDGLQGRGIRCWLDEKSMKPGERILDAVSDAIRLHDRLLVCCSESSLDSWWVKDELRKAQERERTEKRDIIIPLNLDGYVLDGWTDGLATDIRSRLAADFTGWENDNDKFEEQFERVVKALTTGETARDKPPEQKL